MTISTTDVSVSVGTLRQKNALTFYMVNGKVLVFRPAGTPGKVQKIAEVSRDEAREMARNILDMLGEQDQ